MVRRIAVVVSCLLLLYVTTPIYSQQEDSFSQQEDSFRNRVLTSLREALTRYKNLSLQATCHIRFLDKNGLGESNIYLRVKRSGSRVLLSQKEVVDRPGQETRRTQVDFVVEDNGDVQHFQTRLDSSLRQVDYRGPEPDLRISLYSQRLAGKQVVDRDNLFSMMNDAGVALWVVGYAPMLDYLDRATDIQVTQAGGDAEVVAKSEYGRLRLIVSPTNGWLPQTFEVTKDPEHKTTGGSVAVVFNNLVKSVTWTGKVNGFKTDSKGRSSPARIRVNRQTHWKDRPSESIETTIDLQEVIYDPAFVPSDFQTDITAPAGLPVTIKGALNLPYQWDGHAIIPGTSNMPSIPNVNIRFISGSNRWRTLFILFNVLVIVVLFGIFLRKEKRSKPRNQ